MKISEKKFGLLSDGRKAKLFTLEAGDLKLSLTNYGAAWTSLLVPSRSGEFSDVLLGYAGWEGCLNNKAYFGVTVGRFANRIGGASFNLDGKTYNLDKNNGENSLHGGRRGFDKLLWEADTYEEAEGIFVRFVLNSPDGDRGYPGSLKAVVCYGLTKSNEIIASYEAMAYKPCPINLTNHSYFNLAGEGEGSILSHEVRLHSSNYVEIDKQLIPTGRLVEVKDSGFDFLTAKPIRKDMKNEYGGTGSLDGYDHCFAVDGEPGSLRPCAEVFEPVTGRSMKVFTTQPGVQFYTGNNLTGIAGKHGSVYTKHTGFCLETEHFPDSPNHDSFPDCVFGPGKNYHEKAVFKFDW